MYWLILKNIFDQMERAAASGVLPTVDQQLQFESRMGGDGSSPASRILTIAGDQAEIEITGVLTPRFDIMAFLFGGGNTTYGEIIAALVEADALDEIKQITLSIDSPGGSVAGMFDAMAAIAKTKKPVRAVVSNMAASAAYSLASQADEIVAANRAARFGSVGIAVSVLISDKLVSISSSDAPKKNPNAATPEGRAVIQAELDEIHKLLVESIAQGRGVTPEDVNKNFGQGGMMVADGALAAGMIDSINGLQIVKTKTTKAANAGANNSETQVMTLAELKAKHPELYASIFQEGVTAERDRVSAHLLMGETCKAPAIAAKAIRDGAAMSATLTAEYTTAALNASAIAARAADDTGAAGADAAPAASGSESEKDKEAKAGSDILNFAAERCGVALGA